MTVIHACLLFYAFFFLFKPRFDYYGKAARELPLHITAKYTFIPSRVSENGVQGTRPLAVTPRRSAYGSGGFRAGFFESFGAQPLLRSGA